MATGGGLRLTCPKSVTCCPTGTGMRRGPSSETIAGTGRALLDIAALAERLGVTERFVRRLVDERRIPFLKIGRFIRFDPADVTVWIDEQRVEQR